MKALNKKLVDTSKQVNSIIENFEKVHKEMVELRQQENEEDDSQTVQLKSQIRSVQESKSQIKSKIAAKEQELKKMQSSLDRLKKQRESLDSEVKQHKLSNSL